MYSFLFLSLLIGLNLNASILLAASENTTVALEEIIAESLTKQHPNTIQAPKSPDPKNTKLPTLYGKDPVFPDMPIDPSVPDNSFIPNVVESNTEILQPFIIEHNTRTPIKVVENQPVKVASEPTNIPQVEVVQKVQTVPQVEVVKTPELIQRVETDVPAKTVPNPSTGTNISVKTVSTPSNERIPAVENVQKIVVVPPVKIVSESLPSSQVELIQEIPPIRPVENVPSASAVEVIQNIPLVEVPAVPIVETPDVKIIETPVISKIETPVVVPANEVPSIPVAEIPAIPVVEMPTPPAVQIEIQPTEKNIIPSGLETQSVVENVIPPVSETLQNLPVEIENIKTIKTTFEDIPDITDKNFLSGETYNFNAPTNIDEDITSITEQKGFAELLPEDEFGNVVSDEKKESNDFIDSVKNKLIEVKTAVTPDKKEIQQVVDIVVTTPGDVSPVATKSGALDNIKNKVVNIGVKIKGTEESVKASSVVVGSNDNGARIIRGGETFPKPKFEGNKKTSEAEIASEKINNASLKKRGDELKLKSYISGEKTYVEDDDYLNYLNIRLATKQEENVKEPKTVTPKSKRNPSFKNQVVPDELLDQRRTRSNEHVPRFFTDSEKDKIVQRVIEYGLIDELRAMTIDIRDTNAVLGNQYTMLTYATKNKQYEIMKFLINKGASVNKRDNILETPLIVAVKNNDPRAVMILLNAGANPDMKDIFKRTPLIYAIENNHQELGVLLINKGANINIPNSDGEETLSLSTRLKRTEISNRIIEKIRENRDEQS